MPVAIYIGGIEHATLHLIYTRFWTRMMRDLGLVDFDEPVRRLFTQGMVIKDGAKMSKSLGNTVDPDDLVSRYGADTTRLFCLFAAPAEKDLEWSDAGVEGCQRFLGRVWRTVARARERLPQRGAQAPPEAGTGDALALRRKTHDTIRRVSAELESRMRLNTAVAAIMELINSAAALAERSAATAGELWALRESFEVLARLLAPFAPHFAEELWQELGGAGFVARAEWPRLDPRLLQLAQVTLVVQVNGRLRGRVTLDAGASEAAALDAARDDPRVAAQLAGRTLRRVVHVPDKLLNLVVS
jgi:leucyl-tRNA synthetase